MYNKLSAGIDSSLQEDIYIQAFLILLCFDLLYFTDITVSIIKCLWQLEVHRYHYNSLKRKNQIQEEYDSSGDWMSRNE